MSEELNDEFQKALLISIKYLIERGTDVNLNPGGDWIPLISAARLGDLEMVEYLVEKGADVNAETKYGWTALLWAAHYGHIRIVKLLLEKGAKIKNLNND